MSYNDAGSQADDDNDDDDGDDDVYDGDSGASQWQWLRCCWRSLSVAFEDET